MYAKYMDAHGFEAEERPEVVHVKDEELAYVMQRYREVHDFWHVLVDLPPTVAGEVGLKWLEFAQTGLPMAGLAGIVAPVRLSAQENVQLATAVVPWALHHSRATSAVDLMSVYYEELLDEPVDQVRRRLGLTKAPVMTGFEKPTDV